MKRYVLLAVLVAAAPAEAQNDIVVSVDVGAAMATGGFAEDGAQSGSALGVSLVGRVWRGVGLYVDYGRATFEVENRAEFDPDEEWQDRGIGAGVRIYGPTPYPLWRLNPWVEGGVVVHDMAGNGVFALEADASPGFEVALGLDIYALSDFYLVLPVVRYRSYSFEAGAGGVTLDRRDVQYLSFTIGVARLVRW